MCSVCGSAVFRGMGGKKTCGLIWFGFVWVVSPVAGSPPISAKVTEEVSTVLQAPYSV